MRESVFFFFEFEGTSGGPCRELIFEFKSPTVNAACALLLLFVMAEAVAEASRTRPGGSHWRAWSSFRFSPSQPLNNYFITSKSVRRGLQELIKIFVFFQIINFRSDRKQTVYTHTYIHTRMHAHTHARTHIQTPAPQADGPTPLDFPETDDEDEPVGQIDWVSERGVFFG